MEQEFGINTIVTMKNDASFKKYKIVKINKKTFGCTDEENRKYLINKNDVKIDDEKFYLIDPDVEYWVIIKYSEHGKEHTYEYKTLNKVFEKLSEYYSENKLDTSLKNQMYNNLSDDFKHTYTIDNLSTYSIIYVDIYKVDISENYTNEYVNKCTCPVGFKGCGAFCKKHS
jgi:hypothetical protein